MHINEWKEFWWTGITGPRTVITKVADLILNRNTVVLLVPDDLPWRHDMRSAIEAAFRPKAAILNMIIQQIDAADVCPAGIDPGRYLLQRFAQGEIHNAYREKAGISLQKYMVQNNVLRNTIVWIKGLKATHAGNWINFCKGYKASTIEDGLIILEIRGDALPKAMQKIKTVSLTDSVSHYDLQRFNSFILDSFSGYTETWKQYISTVVARLCDIDAEVSEKLISIIDFRSEEPLTGIQRIAEMPEFELRGQVGSEHILACFRIGETDELKKKIWSAQMQTLFPLIEFERMSIVSNWYDEIQQALNIHSIIQYHKKLSDPLDMELGTLVYHLSHKADDHRYFIYIPDDAVRERIRFLHDCRNILAHANCLSVEQVNALIEDSIVERQFIAAV